MAPDERRREENRPRRTQESDRRRTEEPTRRRSEEPDRRGNDRPERRHRNENGLSAMNAAQRAARAVQRLTGRDPESVISVEHADNGWQVGVEVVEAHRIPDSADILATYQAELDGAGRLKGYRRTARYPRGTTRKD